MANKRKWLALLLSVSMLLSMLATIGVVSAGTADATQPTLLWTAYNSFDYVSSGVSQTVVDVDFSDFGDTEITQAVELTLNDLNNTGTFWLHGEGLVGDLTQYPGAYMSLYVKLPDDHAGMNFGIAFVTGDWMSSKGQVVTLAAGGEWQQIVVPLNTDVLSMTNFGLMKLYSIDSYGFKNGDKLSLAGIRVWSGNPLNDQPGEGGGSDQPEEDDEAATVLWKANNGFDGTYFGSGVSQEAVAADFSAFGDTATTEAFELTLSDVNNLGGFWLFGGGSVGDLTKYPDAHLSLYVKMPADHKAMNMGFTFVTGDWMGAKGMYVPFSAGGEWQLVVVPLDEAILTMTDFGFMRMNDLNADNFQNGDKLGLAGIRVWSSKPALTQPGEGGGSGSDPEQPGEGGGGSEPEQPGEGGSGSDPEQPDDGDKEATLLWQSYERFDGTYFGSGVSRQDVEVPTDFSAFGDTETTTAFELTLSDVNNLGNFWLFGGGSVGDLTQYPDAHLSFYVKLPAGHAGMDFGVLFVAGDWMSSKGQTVTLAAGGEWQQIIVPLDEAVRTMNNFGLMRMTTINADNFQNGDKLGLAGIRIWDSKPTFTPAGEGGSGSDPEQPDDGDDGLEPSRTEKTLVWQAATVFENWGQGAGALNAGVAQYLHPVNFIEQFGDADTVEAVEVQLNDMDNLGAFYAYAWPEVNLTLYQNASFSFYYKMPEGPDKASITFRFINADWMANNRMTLELVKCSEWQKVVVPLPAGIMNLSSMQIMNLLDINTANGFENGDKIFFAGCKIFAERPVIGSEGETLQDVPAGYKEAERVLWQSLTSDAVEATGTNKKDVSNDTLAKLCGGYTSAVQMEITDKGSVNSWNFNADSKSPKTVDLTKVIDKAYVAFYVKAPAGFDRKLDVYLYNEDGTSYITRTVTVPAGYWQKVSIKLTSMGDTKMDKFASVRLAWRDGTFKNGDVFEVAGVRVYTNEIVSMLDSVLEDDLTKYKNPYVVDSELLFVHTAEDEATIEGVASKLEKTADAKGEYFDFARSVTIGAIEPGTSWKTILTGKTADLTDVWSTAALRVFFKTPKENTYVNVGLIDKNGNVMGAGVLIEKANVWQEIQIRPSAMRVMEAFDKSAVTAIFVGNEYSLLFEEQLPAANQALLIGGAEIYSDSPVRKVSDDTIVDVTAEADASNIIKMSFGAMGELIKYGTVTADYNNRMDGKNTWRVEFTDDSDDGFELNIPFSRGADSDVYKDFGYISFSGIAEGYVSMNIVISDGTNTYTQAVDMVSEWSEYRIYAYDLALAGVDFNKVSFITLERNRKIMAGTNFNFTAFTKAADLVEIPYVYEGNIYDTAAGENNGASGENNSASGENTAPEVDTNNKDEGNKSPVTGVALPVLAFVTMMMAGVAVLTTRKKKAERK